MLNIAICDDQKVHCKIAYDMIKKYEVSRNTKINIDVYLTGKKLLDSGKAYDFIFMDIELKNENGIVVANDYRRYKNTKIILLTSHKEQMANGYKIKAYRFLVKPVIAEDLFEALDDGQAELDADAKIIVPDGAKEVIVQIRSIMYLEAGDRNTGIRTTKNYYMVHKQISELQNKLPDTLFFMTHRSYIVNLNYVEEIRKTEVILSNNEKIKISRLKYTDFKNRYYEFIRERVTNVL